MRWNISLIGLNLGPIIEFSDNRSKVGRIKNSEVDLGKICLNDWNIGLYKSRTSMMGRSLLSYPLLGVKN